jgi:tryptophan halogenase
MALQKDRDIRRITVVGAGTTGYLTAFHLAKTYPEKTITWIYPEENQPIGVGEAIIPDVSRFLENIGVTHEDIIKKCNGTFKLGIRFEDFNTSRDPFYLFSFGYQSEVPKYNTAALERIMMTDKIPKDIYDYPSISTHFRATSLLEHMDTLLPHFKNMTVIRKTVTLEELEGTYDLIVDCTGFKRSISYRPDNFKSIVDQVPNNRAIIFRHAYTDKKTQCVPYTVIKAVDYGWMWHIPLGDQLVIGYVHDKQFEVREFFHKYVEQKFGISVDPSKFNQVEMITGRNEVHLKDNIVAVGLASSFIEPLESTGLFLVTSSVRKLCEYIDGNIDEDEYNGQVNHEFNALVEFIVAHYKYSDRTNPYWEFFKNVPVKRSPTQVFPDSGWDFILSAFLDDVKRPKEPLDPVEMLNIHKGTPFYKWLENEKNTTQVSE